MGRLPYLEGSVASVSISEGFGVFLKGAPTKERSRYLHLAPGCQKWLLMFFVALTPTSRVHALASSHIAYTRPQANNLAQPHLGRLRARYRSHPRARRRRAQRRACTPVSHEQTLLNQAWHYRRID